MASVKGALEGVLRCGIICGGFVFGGQPVGCVLRRGCVQLRLHGHGEHIVEQLGQLSLVEVPFGLFSGHVFLGTLIVLWRPINILISVYWVGAYTPFTRGTGWSPGATCPPLAFLCPA